MNYCSSCGEKRVDASNYCSKCGMKFDVTKDTQLGNIQEDQLSAKIPLELEEKIVNNSKKDISSKILHFFVNINGKQLFVYNLGAYMVTYLIGFYIGYNFGITINVFFCILFLDFIISGIGYWFRSQQFPNGTLIFCIWTIGLIIAEMTHLNEALFNSSILRESKYLYVLFLTPSAWYLILKNNPNSRKSNL
jgi:hypothetical protein